MDAVVKYIDGLLEKSTPDAPVWNIEKIRQGLKSKWNYIDGCMIKAVLQMYDLTKEEKYLIPPDISPPRLHNHAAPRRPADQNRRNNSLFAHWINKRGRRLHKPRPPFRRKTQW